MKNYERYPGENCIVPTPMEGPAVPSPLETRLSDLAPSQPASEKYAPLYSPAFYGTRKPRLASQEPILLRCESAQQRSA